MRLAAEWQHLLPERSSGAFAGTETVQFYIQDVVSTFARPVRELKQYQKVALRPGEKRTVTVQIPLVDIGYYDETLHAVVEPGEFKIWVGHDLQTEICTSVYVKDAVS